MEPDPSPLDLAYAARADSLVDFYANRYDPSDYAQGNLHYLAANLHRNQNLDWVLARLDSLMARPRGDMFWMYPFTLVTFVGEGRLPEEYRRRMRELWRTYTPYRGDTENHWAMYYASLYLITQLYPDEPPESWFNGKSSSENFEEARDYLHAWMDLTTTQGQGEFDSPHYLNCFIAPMAPLYGFAADPDMKRRAEMMLDYLGETAAARRIGDAMMTLVQSGKIPSFDARSGLSSAQIGDMVAETLQAQ